MLRIVLRVLSLYRLSSIFSMNIEVSRKWWTGVRDFGQPAQPISWGAFTFVNRVLEDIANQMGTRHTAPLDCEDLLVRMQTGLNTIPNPHVLFIVPDAFPASSSPPSAALTFCTLSSPLSSSAAIPSAACVPPSTTQPAASSSSSVAVLPPPLHTSTPRVARKRRSEDDNGNPQKRRRDHPSSSSDEPDSPIPVPVHRPRPRPRTRTRPVHSRMLIDMDQANCVQNRTRAARTPTELYQEPEVANWGRNGTETNAIDGFLPLRRRHCPRMSTCTICYCELTHMVDHTTASPALCVNCGRYKAQNVSIICNFLFIQVAELSHRVPHCMVGVFSVSRNTAPAHSMKPAKLL